MKTAKAPGVGFRSPRLGIARRETAFRDELRKLQYVEGETLAIKWRLTRGFLRAVDGTGAPASPRSGSPPRSPTIRTTSNGGAGSSGSRRARAPWRPCGERTWTSTSATFSPRSTFRRWSSTHRRSARGDGPRGRDPRLEHGQGPRGGIRAPVRGPRHARLARRARRLAPPPRPVTLVDGGAPCGHYDYTCVLGGPS